ncbi:hypothetical protein BO83DRAFT_402596 [Aspergillus eucalypticola CBS 122712]|uniref:Uncharacterized protein n=1 Tax=Aspergillus eucalypticola (strain CBS 122712 / IBT 29274) TaxID=1448314 RepID=A0A317UVR1_ASPEC|nr:uncharacterized protein BO83DRAFT_402596 [Aspergillus eucalypticola CBS 122712]PWY64100.1 hypothetical protein BO83DRAFT_402596 [Aspergillus eucalypticola CBS 122712]
MPILVWCAFEKSSRRGLGFGDRSDDGFRLRLADFFFLYRPMTEEDFDLQIGARWTLFLVVVTRRKSLLSRPWYSNTTHLWLFVHRGQLSSIKTEQPFNEASVYLCAARFRRMRDSSTQNSAYQMNYLVYSGRARSHMMAMTFPGAAYLEYALSRAHNQ